MLQVWCAQINFVNDTLTKTYDQNYDIDAIVSTAVGGLNLDYATDEVGNIKTVLLTNVSFGLEYDKLYRLSHVRDQNAALIEGFTYDRTGNRLSKTLRDTPTLPYDYAASNHKLTNAGTGVRSVFRRHARFPRQRRRGFPTRSRSFRQPPRDAKARWFRHGLELEFVSEFSQRLECVRRASADG